ncbi:N-acetyllactosaminide beta-1,6-N-acetylglucosaminyl-transferase-like isoform X2 [Montipora foliosa]|uniref:N-acetyllactosaminide beta-1,6-N-acetylglucosaminyl-transferase-like isoform X2 n=1 Tax=Montipora foliosa TaxID=591990 RepID=UPI0035F21252
MAVSSAKTVILTCSVLAVAMVLIVQQSDLLTTMAKLKGFNHSLQFPMKSFLNTTPLTVTGYWSPSWKPNLTRALHTTRSSVGNTTRFATTPKLKATKWKRCKMLISGQTKLKGTITKPPPDSEILSKYTPNQDCAEVLIARFGHPPVSEEEKQLPIAYSITLYKSARLFERILQAIYMPNNVYCIHIDKKSPDILLTAIKAMIRCLPNVFIAATRTSVFWGHFSLVQAQFNCMEELSRSNVKWKYYISLVGQDFPLYVNKEIVRALLTLKNHNNIDSFPMPKSDLYRVKYVHLFIKNKNKFIRRGKKRPPPHNIAIYKGATHIIAIREFVDFVLHNQIAKDFVEFLKDTFIPDESVYGSLQQHPLAPGGIRGKQPQYIARAMYWRLKSTKNICKGFWVRALCWITFQDLQWAFGEEKKMKLFVHKIPFNFRNELIDCILVARQGRKYGTTVWK